MITAESLKMNPQQVKALTTEIEAYNVQNNYKRNPMKDNLGKDEFLKLLTTQMSHQDPLAPMDNKDMIAQLAQFSSVEQMLETNKTLAKISDMSTEQASYGMLGHTIDFMDESGNMLKGYVNSLMQNETGISLSVHTEHGSISVNPNDVLMIHAEQQIVPKPATSTEAKEETDN